MKRLIAASAAALTLAACTSGSPAPSQSSSPTPTPTPSPKTATVAQYASAIAGVKGGFESALAKYEATFCDVYYSEDFKSAGDLDKVTCIALTDSVGIRAAIVSTSMDSLSKPASLKFVGQPPAEISQLVQDTVSQGNELQDLATALTECKKNCVGAMLDFSAARSTLKSTLDSWGPYS